MDLHDTKPKAKPSSVRLEQLGTGPVGLTKKELLMVYNALAASEVLSQPRRLQERREVDESEHAVPAVKHGSEEGNHR
jgi:hypothetical protein